MTFNGRNLDNISPFGSDDKPLGKVYQDSAEIILNAALVLQSGGYVFSHGGDKFPLRREKER